MSRPSEIMSNLHPWTGSLHPSVASHRIGRYQIFIHANTSGSSGRHIKFTSLDSELDPCILGKHHIGQCIKSTSLQIMSGSSGGISTGSNLGHINGGHIKSGGRAAREVLTRNTSDDATALSPSSVRSARSQNWGRQGPKMRRMCRWLLWRSM